MTTAPIITRPVTQHHVVPAGSGQVWTLFARTMADRWRSLASWGLGLVSMGAIQLAVYPSVRASGEDMQAFVDQWPEAFREAFGLDQYATGPGFLNAELFSLMIPLVLIGVAVAIGAAATAGEEERGTADLLLSMPTTRGRILLARVAAMVASVTAVSLAMLVTLTIGAPLVDLDVATSGLVAGLLMTALLGLLFGAVALLLGTLTGSRPAALGVALALALAAFLLDVLAPLADWLEPWRDASPFAWALGGEPLTDGFDLPMALLLVAVTGVLFALSWFVYHRRDIATR